MKILYGKHVYETLTELVAPRHTAILVIDMQNDWCHEHGRFWEAGGQVSMITKMVPHLASLVEEARRKGVLIVWMQHTSERLGLSHSPSWIYFLTQGRKYGTPDTDMAVEGSWGQQFIGELQPLPNEPIVGKHRSSAFVNTSLDLVLRSNGIKTVVITGTVTQGCVEATVRGASSYDYYVVVLEDCIASGNEELHEASMKVMASLYDCVNSEDIIAEWARH